MDLFEQRESHVRSYSHVYPTVFTSACNARQFDEAGRSYIDFFAGAGVLNFGHNNPKMKKAIIGFLEQDGISQSLDMYTSTKRDFMQAFVDVILEPRKMNHRMQFTGPTGTNAVEAAIKLARRVTGRQTIIAFSHGFHGMTLGSLACTSNSHFRNASGVPLTHVQHVPFGCETPCMDCEQGCTRDSLSQLRQRLLDSSSGLAPPAAFLVEAIQAEGGVNVASAAWLKQLQALAQEVGALLIIDDIQAGCGRTGSYFSFDNMGLSPDIICLAKGLGGFGTPLAMNLVKPEHDDHWSPGEHTGTFRGQGISFVAGRVALDYFRDDTLMNTVKDKGAIMKDGLERIVSDHSLKALQVRGKGMMQALDFGDGAQVKKIVSRCFEKGLLVGACGTGGRVIKLIPPLTISQEDLSEGLAIFATAVCDVLEAV